MFRIGTFAQICGVTVKTLRHYDKLGLLKPARVDEESGYRYYSAEQLLTIRRIEGFKEQGLTLEMMRPLLTGPVTLTLAERTLLRKRKELERQIHEAQKLLAEIDERLLQIDRHAAAAEDTEITIRSVEPLLVASIRKILPKDQLCLLIDELKQYVSSQGEVPDHDLTIIWHSSHDEESADIEVAIPLSREIPESCRVKVHQMPAIKQAVSYTHWCNPYKDNCKAIETLQSWIANKGYSPLAAIPTREVYLMSDKDIYGQLRMAETIIPIERA
ncbi:MerR family transcriptional regulator [Paenibacillus nanensis]|uniref:MerR family transcriptional regulator n=1 Tax=Paenibacillus nanensis TaxID=393251 RepID=A0A3A1UVE6_9BACL|nr:MerR family transcriptional regulator [Paenibacillus nanensis]RIX52175.1 MerR family transcriptional regulator [Paenibacillus nanensis]